MAEAIFAMEGARCISLGTQTPVTDIALAAEAHSADIVALSFSSSISTTHVLEGLADLRARLPASIEIWAGGACPTLQRRPPSYVRVLDLHGIETGLMQWRSSREA
jgi:methanogenic corrinoid protein MtbC1